MLGPRMTPRKAGDDPEGVVLVYFVLPPVLPPQRNEARHRDGVVVDGGR